MPRSIETKLHMFQFFPGVSPYICTLIWDSINIDTPSTTFTPLKILWALFFLKCYSTEDVSERISNVDQKNLQAEIGVHGQGNFSNSRLRLVIKRFY